MKRLVLLLLCAVMVLGLFGCTQPQVPTEPSQSETPSQSSEPSQSQASPFDLREYDSQVDTSVLTDETIFALLREAEDLAAQYDSITVENTDHYFSYYLPGGYLSDPLILLKETAFTQEESYAYGIFLALVLQEYGDCSMEYDYRYALTMGRPWFHYIYVCPEFRTSGYATVKEYREAIEAKEIPEPEQAWMILYTGKSITSHYGDRTIDLYEQYRNA